MLAPDRDARSDDRPVVDRDAAPRFEGFVGDVEGDGSTEAGAPTPAPLNAPCFSTCAVAKDLSAGGTLAASHSAKAAPLPTRRMTSSASADPAARAGALLSDNPVAAAAMAHARSRSSHAPASPVGPRRAQSIQPSASAFPSPLIFPVSSTILLETPGSVLASPALTTHRSSAPHAAARTFGFESPICLTTSPSTPWLCRRSPAASPIASITLPAAVREETAMFLLLSAKRFASAGRSSPVFGAILRPAEASISSTESTAAARTFQLASLISFVSFSVTRAEISARGNPPPTLAAALFAPPSAALTILVPTPAFPGSCGFLANSASSDLSCASLTSVRYWRRPGPTPACSAPSALPAADLHAGLGSARHSLHHSIWNPTSIRATPNSDVAVATQSRDSATTLGFLCPVARSRRR